MAKVDTQQAFDPSGATAKGHVASAVAAWKWTATQDRILSDVEINEVFEIPNIYNFEDILIDVESFVNEYDGRIDGEAPPPPPPPPPTPEGEFGTQISEEQGDNMGASTGGISQWSSSGHGVGALLSDVDWANITANATIGYDAVTQQLMIIWDASSAGSGNAFVYSFRTANWYRMTDATAQSVNMTNFANGRNNIVYVGGGSASTNTSKLADRTGATTVDVISADIFMENVESVKNLTRVSVTYKGGAGTSVALGVATNSTGSFTTIGTLDSTSTSYATETFSLTSDSNFKTKKSFQIRLNGAAASTFEIQDVSLVYRNLGIRV